MDVPRRYGVKRYRVMVVVNSLRIAPLFKTERLSEFIVRLVTAELFRVIVPIFSGCEEN